MITASCRHLLCAAGVCLAFVLSACSAVNRLPPNERSTAQLEAQAALQQLALTNASLSSFKGLGRIKLWDTDRPPSSERVAWIASAPEKLGIVVLAAGRPVVRVAADGQFIYMVDLRDPVGSYVKMRTSDASLDRLIRMPITVTDIIAILAGRTPIRDHSDAFLQKDRQTEQWLLVIEHWWQVVEKIYLSADRKDVRRMEVFGAGGKVLYRVEFEEMQNVMGYRVPRRLHLSDDAGNGVQLDIEQFLTDVPVTSTMFILPPPDSSSP
jgi:outer membrane biogenesis lipoprotein LolB